MSDVFFIEIYHLVWLTLLLSPLSYAATNCSLVTEISQAECEALLDLYNSTNGSQWTDNTGWNDANEFICNWRGVGCYCAQKEQEIQDENGNIHYLCFEFHISSIFLEHNNLVGTIPNSIGNLINLKILSLYDNYLTGTIPDSIGNLTNLMELNLSESQLTTLPNSVSNLTNLQSLRLSNNQLTPPPDSIGNLTSLELLSLEGNQLTTLPDFLSN